MISYPLNDEGYLTLSSSMFTEKDEPSVPPAPWKVKASKDSDNSEKCRIAGNKVFKKKKFELALDYYNRSLCYAPAGSRDLALGYGNRSAVYCEMGWYALAIENIKLARENGFPAERMAYLDDREEKCRKLMEEFGPTKFGSGRQFVLQAVPSAKFKYSVHCRLLGAS